MSDRRFREDTGPKRRFVPSCGRLESRCLLSRGFHSVFVIPLLKKEESPPPPPPPLPPPPPPPKQGGTFVQSGAVVGINVGQPPRNGLQIDNNGGGNYQAQWNGGSIHSFAAVQAVYVLATRARHDAITINLNDVPAATPDAEPSSGRATSAIVAHASLDPPAPTHGGIVRQNGALLTVTVDRSTTNSVQILDSGALRPGPETWSPAASSESRSTGIARLSRATRSAQIPRVHPAWETTLISR